MTIEYDWYKSNNYHNQFTSHFVYVVFLCGMFKTSVKGWVISSIMAAGFTFVSGTWWEEISDIYANDGNMDDEDATALRQVATIQVYIFQEAFILQQQYSSQNARGRLGCF